MKLHCPYCHNPRTLLSDNRTVVRRGVFYRKSDGQHVARFWCKRCKNGFSAATLNLNYGQKKRQFNDRIRRILAAKVSQREAARFLGVNRKTIARKLLILGPREKEKMVKRNKQVALATDVQFDDLETFVHTKCKPVSVTLAVEARTRRILDFEVSQMPAKGRLAKTALKKYGARADHRGIARRKLFSRLQKLVSADAVFTSDSNPHYPATVKRYFPRAEHKTVLGGRSAVTGQGELKKLGHDPIFSLNHTCAMFRDHVGGLVRKTWGSHRCIKRLEMALSLYANEHNRRLSTA